MNIPTFGQPVLVSKVAYKCIDNINECTYWKTKILDEPKKGLYIGKRTVYDGRWKWTTVGGNDFYDPPDEISYFHRDNQHTVFVIVFNERENPVKVFPEDIEII